MIVLSPDKIPVDIHNSSDSSVTLPCTEAPADGNQVTPVTVYTVQHICILSIFTDAYKLLRT